MDQDLLARARNTDMSTKLVSVKSGKLAARPLKIAILSYRSTPHVGGQGIYVDYLSRALVERGHTVDILSGPPYPECDPRVRIIEIPSLDLYTKPHNGHYELRPRHLLSWADTSEYFSHLTGKFSEPITFGHRVRKYLSKSQTDYDVILDNQSLSRSLLAPHIQSTAFVGVIHHPITRDIKLDLGDAPDWKKRWLTNRWYSFHKEQIRTARKLPFIITPSEATKADIIAEFDLNSEQLNVIPLGVDQQTFRPDPTVKRHSSQIITTASADVPLKGLKFLLEALAIARQTRPDISLLVIGKLRDGPTKDTVKKLQLEDAVTFRSGLTRDELARAFQEASLSVTPSLYEGFGLPCAEAMSCATPVITSDGGALPEVIGDAGTIFPKGNVEALSQALLDFFSLNSEERSELSERAFRRASKHFNWMNLAPLYESVFEKAIQSKC